MTTTNFIELAGIGLTDLSASGQWKVAEAKTTPEEVLMEFIANRWALKAVASNRSATEKVIRAVWEASQELREWDRYAVVAQIAKNPNTPSEIMDPLTEHKYADIRKFAFSHRNTSLKLIERGARSLSPQGRAAAKELAHRNAA